MKNAKAMFGAIILGLTLSSAALAGDVSTPGYVPPPPPPSAEPLQQNEAADLGDYGYPDLATDFLIAALSAFYQ
jgi:hypothetical protein